MPFNEDSRVKIPALVHLTRLGYTFLPKAKMKNIHPDTNIFVDVFKAGVSRINHKNYSDDEISAFISELNNQLDNNDLGKRFYASITGDFACKLIDFEDFEQNLFHIVTELTYKKDEEEFRPDITVLINGMPLAFIEVKKPNNHDGILAERDRINRRFRPYFKRIGYATFDGRCSANVLVLKCKNDKFHAKFVYYSLFQDLFFRHMMNGAKGSKMPRGDKDQIMEFQIPDLDKPDQIRIADILSALDAKISLNTRINAELEQLARTIYNYWFVQFDYPISAAEAAAAGKPELEGKPYRSTGGAMVWNEELKREVPVGWGVKSLDQLGEFKNGINYEGDVVGDKIVRIVNVRDISNSTYFILKDGLDEISLPEKDLIKYLVHENDILIARSGTPGATRLIHKDIEDVIYCGFIIRFNVTDDQMKKYLFFGLKDIELSLTNQAAGTILKNVSQDTLKDLRVVTPTDEIIESFNDIMSPVFDSIYNFSLQSQELVRHRDFLLPLLMSGEVSLKC